MKNWFVLSSVAMCVSYLTEVISEGAVPVRCSVPHPCPTRLLTDESDSVIGTDSWVKVTVPFSPGWLGLNA